MTDKEFKRLSRAQLIDIIYQLQLNQEELEAQNEKMKSDLEDRRLKMERSGNIAEAALEINQVLQAAQNAAEQYMEEVRLTYTPEGEGLQHLVEDAREQAETIVKNAREEADRIIREAKLESTKILTQTKEIYDEYTGVIEAILREYQRNRRTNRW